MWKTGLTSITFRQLSCEEIIALTVQGGLDGIEWGGDGHVRPGEAAAAAEVGKKTRDAGLEVLSLGSYYRPGAEDDAMGDEVLALARALETKTIRVWAGRLGSLAAEIDGRKKVIASLKLLCQKAAAEGVTICTEYHGNTLTDNAASALRMFAEVDEANLRTYWQPVVYDEADANARALQAVLPHTENIHVFAWTPDAARSIIRHPLAEAEEAWIAYIEVLRQEARDRAFMVEFVEGDAPEAFLEDAATLKRWITR